MNPDQKNFAKRGSRQMMMWRSFGYSRGKFDPDRNTVLCGVPLWKRCTLVEENRKSSVDFNVPVSGKQGIGALGVILNVKQYGEQL